MGTFCFIRTFAKHYFIYSKKNKACHQHWQRKLLFTNFPKNAFFFCLLAYFIWQDGNSGEDFSGEKILLICIFGWTKDKVLQLCSSEIFPRQRNWKETVRKHLFSQKDYSNIFFSHSEYTILNTKTLNNFYINIISLLL